MLSLREKNVDKFLTDSVLVEKVTAGESAAFEILMRRYNRVLYRTARSIVKDDAEAEDVVQEAYILAYRSLGKFRGEAKLGTWLTRIVVNEAVARLRKAVRRAEIIRLDADLSNEPEEDGTTIGSSQTEQPEQAAIRAEARRLLERKIDELPEAFRTVFVLRVLEEMSVEEISAALDIPEATVRTRHYRAKSLLRESLSRELDFAMEEAFSFAGERCDRIVAGVMRKLEASTDDLI